MSIVPSVLAKWKSVLISMSSFVLLTACTIQQQPEEHPNYEAQQLGGSSKRIEKSFFEFRDPKTGKLQVDAKTGKIKRKFFICGWSPEVVTNDGAHTSGIVHANMAGHCNVTFDITEKALIAYEVSPGLMGKYKRSSPVFSIPINKHYYYEKVPDGNGRETNTWHENASRSHWKARPLLDLALDRIQFIDKRLLGSMSQAVVTNVYDEIWDRKSGFMGLTMEMTDLIWSDKNAAVLRFNIKEFVHKSVNQFKPTPYDWRNAKFLNVLHVLGTRHGGVAEELYAGRWDTKVTHKVALRNFPKEYESVAFDVISLWNDEFEQIGHGRPFQPYIDKSKYGFDLRKISINWVDDLKYSSSAPLGMGLATSDVRNGEMLWGNVTVWGGMIDWLANRNAPATSLMAKTGFELQSTPALVADQVDFLQPQDRDIGKSLETYRNRVTKFVDNNLVNKGQLSMESSRVQIDKLMSDVAQAKYKFSEYFQRPDRLVSSDLQALIGMPSWEDSIKGLPQFLLRDKLHSNMTKKTLFENITFAARGNTVNPKVVDLDREAGHVLPQWYAAIRSGAVTKDEARKALVKDLLLHEFGHMLGLGHNFEGNVLPDKGSVPDSERDLLVTASQNNMVGYSTVMDYKHGTTDAVTPYSDLKPGPYDRQVLNFIYNRKYPLYPVGATGAEDIRYEEVDLSGEIPKFQKIEGVEYRQAYYPSCNDWEASLGKSPFCARFDRGYNAQTIVKSYLGDLDANISTVLNQMVSGVGGEDYKRVEGHMWRKTLRAFNGSRFFYDYMRREYWGVLNDLLGSENSALGFSKVCETGDTKDPLLKKVVDHPEFEKIQDLCLSTKYFVEKMAGYLALSGKDYTEIDSSDYNIPSSQVGGDADSSWGLAWGRWTSLSRTPIKYNGVLVLTTPFPYSANFGYLMPIHSFANETTSFHLASLFPEEYVKAIGSAIETNFELGTESREGVSRIGNTVLYLGYMLNQIMESADVSYLNKNLLDAIRSISNFSYSMSFIRVTKNEVTGNKELAKEFTGKIYNSDSNVDEDLEVYLYKYNQVIIKPSLKSLIYPLSEVRWMTSEMGIVPAYKLDYQDDYFNKLKSLSVRARLQEMYGKIVKKCIEGPKGEHNGLADHFTIGNDSNFKGFDFPIDISSDNGKIKFFSSLEEEFDKYYSSGIFTNTPNPKWCDEALKGQNALVSVASAINGIFLPDVKIYTGKKHTW